MRTARLMRPVLLMKTALFIGVCCCLLVDAVREGKASQSLDLGGPEPTIPAYSPVKVHVISHAHLDPGWLKTLEEYLYGQRPRDGFANVVSTFESVTDELLKDASRTFVLCEMSFFSRWYDQLDDKRRHTVAGLLESGQLSIVGGGWVTNDEATTAGVDIIDQMTLGHLYIKQQFGPKYLPTISWQLDPFGHSSFHAYVAEATGMDATFFSRLDYQESAARYAAHALEGVWGEGGMLFSAALVENYCFPSGMTFDIGYSWTGVDPLTDSPLLSWNGSTPLGNVPMYMDMFRNYSLMYSNSTNFASESNKDVFVFSGCDYSHTQAAMEYGSMDKLKKYAPSLAPEIEIVYSTPQAYVQARKNQNRPVVDEPLRIDAQQSDAKPRFHYKKGDFFPYISHPGSLTDAASLNDLPLANMTETAYWTGYYSSRPGLKAAVRQASRLLAACRSMEADMVLSGRATGDAALQWADATFSIWETSAILSHHDLVAGTSKTRVSQDAYDRLLYSAKECQSLSRMYPGAPFEETPVINATGSYRLIVRNVRFQTGSDFVFRVRVLQGLTVNCEYANVVWTYTPPYDGAGESSTGISIVVLRTTEDYILSPMSLGAIEFTVVEAHPGPPVASALNAGAVPGSTGWLTKKVNLSGKNGVSLSGKNGVSLPGKSKVLTVSESPLDLFGGRIKVRLGYYTTSKQDDIVHNSGAYSAQMVCPDAYDAFSKESDALPNESDAPSRESNASLNAPGSSSREEQYFCDITPIISGDWFNVTLIYTSNFDAELHWSMGEIPIDEEALTGKEIVVRVETFIDNQVGDSAFDTEFYTDSNAWNLMRRVANKRDSFNVKAHDLVSSNYYPVASTIAIRDKNTNQVFGLLVDRAVGGSSLKKGQVEIVINRRTSTDDYFGLDEPINEALAFPRVSGIIKGYLTIPPTAEELKSDPDAWMNEVVARSFGNIRSVFVMRQEEIESTRGSDGTRVEADASTPPTTMTGFTNQLFGQFDSGLFSASVSGSARCVEILHFHLASGLPIGSDRGKPWIDQGATPAAIRFANICQKGVVEFDLRKIFGRVIVGAEETTISLTESIQDRSQKIIDWDGKRKANWTRENNQYLVQIPPMGIRSYVLYFNVAQSPDAAGSTASPTEA